MFQRGKFWRGMVHVYIVLDCQRFSLTWSQDVYVNIVRMVNSYKFKYGFYDRL